MILSCSQWSVPLLRVVLRMDLELASTALKLHSRKVSGEICGAKTFEAHLKHIFNKKFSLFVKLGSKSFLSLRNSLEPNLGTILVSIQVQVS